MQKFRIFFLFYVFNEPPFCVTNLFKNEINLLLNVENMFNEIDVNFRFL